MAVEIDHIVHPALSVQIHVDPGVVQVPGVTHHQLGGTVLGAQHDCHQSRVVEADSLFLGQHHVHVGQVAGLDGGRLGRVVGDVGDHIVVDVRNHGHLISGPGADRRSGLNRGAGRVEVHVLVGVQERTKLVGNVGVYILAEGLGILVARDIFKDLHLVGAAALGQGKHLVHAAVVQIVCIGGGPALGDLHLDLGVAAQVFEHNVALAHVGGV